MRIEQGVKMGVARGISAFGSFGGLPPTKPRFQYFRPVAVPDIRKSWRWCFADPERKTKVRSCWRTHFAATWAAGTR